MSLSARTLGGMLLLSLIFPAQAGARAEDPCSAESAETLAMVPAPGAERSQDPDGIGGTGNVGGSRDGIGGTGRAPSEGLGGTGLFGTITAFGSVCVNGVKVELGSDTEVTLQGKAHSADRLRVGQVVWVVAHEEGGALRAKKVAAWLAARGEIQRVDPGRRRFRVGGRWITLLDAAQVVDQTTAYQLDPRGLRVGESVAVSGLEDADRRIFATRVDRLSGSHPSQIGLPDVARLARDDRVQHLSVEGFVGVPAEGELRVGALPVFLPRKQVTATPLVRDTRVWVRGRAEASGLRVETVVLPPARISPPVSLPMPVLRDIPVVPDAPRVRPELDPRRTVPPPSSRPVLPDRTPSRERPVRIDPALNRDLSPDDAKGGTPVR